MWSPRVRSPCPRSQSSEPKGQCPKASAQRPVPKGQCPKASAQRPVPKGQCPKPIAESLEPKAQSLEPGACLTAPTGPPTSECREPRKSATYQADDPHRYRRAAIDDA